MKIFLVVVSTIALIPSALSQIIQQPTGDTICAGESGVMSIKSSYSNSGFAWQISEGGIWSNLIISKVYSGVQTDTLIFNQVPDTLNDHWFRCVIDTNGVVVQISDSAKLTVQPLPNNPGALTANLNPIQCPYDSTILRIFGGPGLNHQWVWYEGGCGVDSVGNGSVLHVKPNQSKSYFVRAEGVCGVTSCSSLLLVVNKSISQLPTALKGANKQYCPGESVVLQPSGGNLGTGAVWEYFWDTTSAVIDSGTLFQITTDTTRDIFVRANGDCNTTSFFQSKINVTSPPTVQIMNQQDTAICLGSTIRFSPDVKGAYPLRYHWSPESVFNDPYQMSPIVYPKHDLSCTLTVSDSNQCQSSDTVRVFVKSLPQLDDLRDTSICKSGFAQPIVSANRTGLLTWFPNQNISDRHSNQPIIFPDITTTYVYQFIDSMGCQDSGSIRILVLAKPDVKTDSAVYACSGEVIKLEANGGKYYQWQPEDYFSSPQISNPEIFSGQFARATVIAGNEFGCYDTAYIAIHSWSNPDVIGVKDTGICTGDTLEISAVKPEGGQIKWFNGQTGQILSIGEVLEWTAGMSNLLKVQAVDSNQCSTDKTITIRAFDLPRPRIEGISNTCPGDTFQLHVNGTDSFKWSGFNILGSMTESTITAVADSSRSFFVIGTNEHGCVEYDSFSIKVGKLPDFSIITNDTQVCKGSIWKQYCADLNPSLRLWWEVKGGVLQTGQGAACIKVRWDKNTDDGSVLLTATTNDEFNCKATRSVVVKLNGDAALPEQKLLLKANQLSSGIVICKDCDFQYYYWGVESKLDHREAFNCTGEVWCAFPELDTSKNYYWLKAGDDTTCLTKSYLFPPIYHSFNSIDQTSLQSIFIYPNPTYSNITISATFPIDQISCTDSWGKQVEIHHPVLGEKQMVLDLTHLSNGIYTIRICTEFGETFKRIYLNK